ncbi:hypothetical protein B0H14DRAFT_3464708 [Mycena olivaceomarginata]|nr:hypothetical protein B0H14DRAFT_3464708 [Mycena olivaceomarginata]
MSSTEPTEPTEAEKVVLQSVKNKLAHSLLTKATKSASQSQDSSGDENDPSGKDPEDEETYKSYGRHLARTCGMLERIHVIVEHGVRMALASSDDEAAGPPPDAKQQKKLARLSASWEILCHAIPGFREEMIQLGGSTKLRRSVCRQVNSSWCSTLNIHLTRVVVIDWLLHFHDPDVPIAPADIPSKTSKTGRAFNNSLTGEALCPHEYPATAESKMATSPSLSTGRCRPSSIQENHPYNKDDIEEKLLEGPLPIAAAKQIYQGPSAALQEPGFHRGRAGNAARNGQDTLGPRDVAYVCTQVYHLIIPQIASK